MPDYQDITLDVADSGVATMILDRPDSMNTISSTMKAEIVDALDVLEGDDSVRVLVIRGRGEVFCAGADVSSDAPEEPTMADLLAQRRSSREFFGAIERFPKPTVAAIEGYALGGGCEIACCCDTRIAAESARIGVPEIKLGVIPAGGGTQRLSRLIGTSRARDMVLRGTHYTAAEMHDFGFVHELAADDEFDDVVEEVEETYLNRPPIAMEIAKHLAIDGFESSLEGGLVMESFGATILAETEDREEGMAAFREKRDPNFQGR